MHGGLSNATRLAPATARRAQGQNALLRAPQTTRARPPRARIGPPTVGSKGGLAHRTWDFSPTERGIPPCFRREPRPSNVGTYRGTIEVRQQHLQSWHLHPLQEPTHAGAPTTARSPARAAGARELPTPPPTAPNGHHSAPGTTGRATRPQDAPPMRGKAGRADGAPAPPGSAPHAHADPPTNTPVFSLFSPCY